MLPMRFFEVTVYDQGLVHQTTRTKTMRHRVKKLLITLMFFSSVSTSLAAEDAYKYCVIAGFANGADDRLILSLALQVIADKGVLGTPVCSAAWKNSNEEGKKFTNTGTADPKVLILYSDFKTAINKAILKAAGF